MTLTTMTPRLYQRDDLRVLALAGMAAVLLGAASMLTGVALALALAVVVLFVTVAIRPVAAAYIYLAALPFVTGIGRGAVIPLLRPNEALQALLTAAVLAGLYVRFLQGETPHITFTRLDRALLVLATLASAWPLVWGLVRSHVPTSADVMSTVPLWRYVALYALYRFVAPEPKQVRRCMWILLAGAAALALIAALQSLNLLNLGTLWASESAADSEGRGNATLSSAIAVGDYLACSLAVVLAWALRSPSGRRPLLYITGGILLVGALGSGQFSAWIGTLIVVVLVAAHEGQLRRLVTRAAPVAVIGVALTWPVVAKRLDGFGSGFGLPSSWIGRIDNLTNFYLPALGGFRWVLGVRPDSVLPAPETWRDVIYLESGLLWFLWVGGIPLLIGAVWFFRVAMRHTREIARRRSDDVGILALATWSGLWVFAVLSLIDMHLTLRGAGDLLFILLGLSSIRSPAPAAPPAETRQASAAPDSYVLAAEP
jgi:hypothetical protein